MVNMIVKKSMTHILLSVALIAALASLAVLMHFINNKKLEESGFPDFSNMVLAKIFVYDDDGRNERSYVLEDKDLLELRAALLKLGAHGNRIEADQLNPQSGWHWKKFLVKMKDGQEYQVTDVYQHVLLNDSYAWKANDYALAELANLYCRLIGYYKL